MLGMSRIAILDYGIGNVRSISNALDKIGASSNITRDEKTILSSDGLILPGVGAFAHGMNNLTKFNLKKLIYNFVDTGKPLLGICLGMQLLMETSSEFGITKGLGLIRGNVNKLSVKTSKLPHVAWSEISPTSTNRWSNTILENTIAGSNFYFVHTFAANPMNIEDSLSLTLFDDRYFCSSVHRDNIYGMQFHPEKSGIQGLNILKTFAKISAEHDK